jgi:hypothetical protein
MAMVFKPPLGQITGMVASPWRVAVRDWLVPDSSTLCRRQNILADQIPYRRAAGSLNLLVDSTGVKFLGNGDRGKDAVAGSLEPVILTLLDLKPFGEHIAARAPGHQAAKRHIRITLMNRLSALGTAERSRLLKSKGKGKIELWT